MFDPSIPPEDFKSTIQPGVKDQLIPRSYTSDFQFTPFLFRVPALLPEGAELHSPSELKTFAPSEPVKPSFFSAGSFDADAFVSQVKAVSELRSDKASARQSISSFLQDRNSPSVARAYTQPLSAFSVYTSPAAHQTVQVAVSNAAICSPTPATVPLSGPTPPAPIPYSVPVQALPHTSTQAPSAATPASDPYAPLPANPVSPSARPSFVFTAGMYTIPYSSVLPEVPRDSILYERREPEEAVSTAPRNPLVEMLEEKDPKQVKLEMRDFAASLEVREKEEVKIKSHQNEIPTRPMPKNLRENRRVPGKAADCCLC